MGYDFKNLKDHIPAAADGGRQEYASGAAESPFAEYESAATDTEPVYTVNEDREIDEYGGERKLVQEVDHAMCPSCGGAMRYDPESGKLKCDFCGTLSEIDYERASERSLKFGYDTAAKWRSETRVYRCENCGSESVFSKTEFSAVCPFCGSSSVTDVEDLEGVRPNAVVPFGLTEDKARESFAKWIKRRFYAPRAFKQKAKLTAKGVYTPCWTFDSATYSRYTAVVGDYYYVTVGSGKNRRTERRVRYRTVGGTHSAAFDDVVVHAGGQVEPAYFRKMGALPTRDAAVYNGEYLAGYTAEHYVTSLEDGWVTAQGRMRSEIERQIRMGLHCDVVQSVNVETNFSDSTFKYLLYPVYIVRRMFRGKNYKFFVNGVTGQAAGKYPVSAPRVTFTVLGALAVIGAIVACVLLL